MDLCACKRRMISVKKIKKWMSVMLALSVMISLLMIPAQETQAAETASVTKAVHLNVGTCKDGAISITFAAEWDHVKNLKTSSKNLKAKITSINMNTYNQQTPDTASISLYAIKKGTYTVSFDIYNESEKKVSSHTVKVYVNTDQAIKSVTFAGEQTYALTEKTKGKLAVTMNKGYTLKKIILETYDKTGEEKTQQVKNNSIVTLGKYPHLYKSGKMYEDYYHMSTSLMTYTGICVYYIDKYTNEETYEFYYLHGIAE